ncbi:MAG TPA: HD domain-containing protein [Candidatus Kapabacteria bacterium]|nr:HD domain-containing protein [Candidatus Kapabacteria bacterium]
MESTRRTIEIQIPIIHAVGDIARQEGTSLYLVGGYVRDLLMGRAGNDIDFTIEGSGVDFARIVAREFRTRAVVFERFGTAMVPLGDYKLEFVGTRKEEYLEDSRKPIVTDGTLEDDLRRRDFTVNAMAVRIDGGAGELIDLFDGYGDLERRLLRTPLEPHTTYSEDPLRMMRAARFSAQLGFDLDLASFKAIRDLRERIRIISQERVSEEFLKILAAPKPSIGLALLFQSGLMELIFPEVWRLEGVDLVKAGDTAYAHKDVFWHTLKVVDNIALMTDNVWLRFAALMHDIAKPRTKRFREGSGWTFHGHEEMGARWQDRIFRRMKLPMKEAEYVARLVRLHHRPMVLVEEGVTDSAIRRLVVDAGDDLDDLFTLCRADITSRDPRKVQRYLENYDLVIERILEVREKDALRAFQSPVRGEEIMEICGIPPSKTVGILKSAIEEAILDGRIPNEYEAAREYLLQIKDRVLAGEAV